MYISIYIYIYMRRDIAILQKAVPPESLATSLSHVKHIGARIPSRFHFDRSTRSPELNPLKPHKPCKTPQTL